MWLNAKGECITQLHFPQQVAMVRHALRAYGQLTTWMAFFDVDEFFALGFAPSIPVFLDRAVSRLRERAESLTPSETRWQVGGVRVRFVIMLPRNASDTRRLDDSVLLMRTMIRRLPASMAPSKFDSWKCIIKPTLQHPVDVFGSIHRLRLAEGARYYVPEHNVPCHSHQSLKSRTLNVGSSSLLVDTVNGSTSGWRSRR